MKSWNEEFLELLKERIRYLQTMRPLVKKHVKETLEEEIENFLFIAASDNVLIKGMHYAESAFTESDEIPLIFNTSEDNVIIAAWPQSKITELIEEIETNYPQEEWDSRWKRVLEGLVKDSEKKLHTAKDII